MSWITDMLVELKLECIEFRKGLNPFQRNRLVTENHCAVEVLSMNCCLRRGSVTSWHLRQLQ
jgi:hypothetical protein